MPDIGSEETQRELDDMLGEKVAYNETAGGTS